MASPLPPAALLRADTQSMLTYIQGARIVSMAREAAISQLYAWLILRFWLTILTVTLALLAINLWDLSGWWGSGHAPLLSGLILLVLASRTAAIISVGRRMTSGEFGSTLSGDSIYELAALGSGKNNLAIALLSSNVFGLVMYAILASGLTSTIGLTGGVVPQFAATEEDFLREAAADDALNAIRSGLAAAACEDKSSAAASPSATPTAAATIASSNVTARAPIGRTAPTPAATTADQVVENTATPASASNPSPSPSASTTPKPSPPPASSCTKQLQDARAAKAIAEASQKKSEAATKVRSDHDRSGDTWIETLRHALGLATVPDLFKLLLWAFIAGFAEKFVPDILDTLTAKKKKEGAGTT